MGLEAADKEFVGNDAGLLESVHTLSDLDVDVAEMERREYSTTTSFGMSLRWIRMYWKLAIGLLS